MGFGRKHDYPPLLAPGRHYMTLADIKGLCVDRFPDNIIRRNLYYKFEQMYQALLICCIPCDIWIDGSVLTEKAEPDDFDATIIIDEDVLESLIKEQQELIDSLGAGEYIPKLDSFVFARLRRDNPVFGTEADAAFSWGEQYGCESGEEWLKGFAVLRLRETDVGLRIRR